MRDVPATMEKTWRSGDYIGDKAPRVRVTAQKPRMRLRDYNLTSTFSLITPSASGTSDILNGPTINPLKPRRVNNTYADFLFSDPTFPKELPNVSSVNWDRTLDVDAATCTITLWNVKELAFGDKPQPGIDHQGYYTYDHGKGVFANSWGHASNSFAGLLMPDNILRTYEGYGWNPAIVAEKDPNLLLTGVWVIDSIAMSSDGSGVPTLVCQCRDMARLLLDQICFPPVVPKDFYPLSFRDWNETFRTGTVKVKVGERTTGVKWGTYQAVKTEPVYSSNSFWNPENPAGTNYFDRLEFGHKVTDINRANTYWLSIDNSSNSRGFAYEYVDFNMHNASVNKVAVSAIGTGYNVYLSVMIGGKWIGGSNGKIINYNSEGVGLNKARIPYVAKMKPNGNGTFSRYLKRSDYLAVTDHYERVQKIRITLGNLQAWPGIPGPRGIYRAALQTVQAYGPAPSKKEPIYNDKPVFTKLRPGPAGANPGRAQDFTDIVKLLCAWGGLYWDETGYIRRSDNTTIAFTPTKDSFDDDVLGYGVRGRVWGDFQQTGTMAATEIGTSQFDKKSLMDGINAIKEITGFVFYIDESGGAQWRLPNIYEEGNIKTGLSARPGRTRTMYTIDERQVLMNLESTIDSRNVRETIFVASSSGLAAGVVAGYNPNYVGLRRTGGWSDQDFTDARECKMMADMIAVRQLFSYRTDRLTVPGFPGLQIDDQVRIVERVTSEGNIHYIKGISSSHDVRSGEWNYTLQTHWLGDRVGNKWVLGTNSLTDVGDEFVSGARAQPAVVDSRL